MTCPACQVENEDDATFCRACGAELSRGLAPGTVVHGRYEIQKLLGRGGMGIVYKAHDRSLDETVAIKLLRAEVAASNLAKRFRSEIKLARKVGHKNVCRIFEYGEDAGFQYICMEYIDGVDLRAVLRRGRLQRLEAFDLSLQVMAGLEAIHEGGIIHRDLKTANIMRDTRGVAKLMDFGIAKEWGVTGGTGATQTGQIIGTPDYMSPEQARGAKIDFRSDIYALGIVIFELFTGHVPFRSDTPLATILKHLSEPPPLEDPEVARALGALVPAVRCALAKDPGQRFSHVGEMAAAFRAAEPALASSSVTPMRLPVVGVPPTTPTRPTHVPPVEATVMPDDVEPTIGMTGDLGVDAGSTRTSVDVATPTRTRALPLPAPTRVVPPPAAARGPLLGAIAGAAAVLAGIGGWLALRPRDNAPVISSPTPSPIVATTLRARETPNVLIAEASAPVPAAPAVTMPAAAPPPRAAAAPAAPATVRPTPPPRIEPTPVAASATPQVVVTAPAPSAAPSPSTEPSPTAASLPPAVTKRGDLVAPGPGVVPPQVLSVAKPAYPTAAKKLNKDSTVLVRVLVDEDGKVQQAEILLGDASGFGFNEAALQAAKKTTFRPPNKYGVAVRMWTNLPVVFIKP